MHRAIRAACFAMVLAGTPALGQAQEVTLLEKFKDWTAYAATGTPKTCFAVAKPTESNPKKIKRGPILFYISQWPADKVSNEVSVKMGYPFSEGAKTTVTVGSEKFEMFTKDEGAFVEKPEMETKLIEAMKTGNTMKIEGKSARGTATTDVYSLNGLSDALDRAAKECSG
ncbi:MAG TPA: invasion associated locus B family protein [Methyloceanibacter sp.]|nr:invasion associated locus B family protein [Methyloceanibacter sp.]